MASKVPGIHSKSHSRRKAPPPSLWIPKSYEELNELLRTHPVQDGRYQRGVVQPAPGVLIKYKGDFAEEVCAMRYAQKHFSFPIPQILHHPSLRRGTPRGRYVPGRPVGVWYICMEQCPGVSLNNVIDAMTPAELNQVAEQLRQVLAEMATIRPKTLGSVTGGPYRNSYVADSFPPTHAFTSVFELIDAYRYLLIQSQTCTESFTDALLSNSLVMPPYDLLMRTWFHRTSLSTGRPSPGSSIGRKLDFGRRIGSIAPCTIRAARRLDGIRC